MSWSFPPPAKGPPHASGGIFSPGVSQVPDQAALPMSSSKAGSAARLSPHQSMRILPT